MGRMSLEAPIISAREFVYNPIEKLRQCAFIRFRLVCVYLYALATIAVYEARIAGRLHD